MYETSQIITGRSHAKARRRKANAGSWLRFSCQRSTYLDDRQRRIFKQGPRRDEAWSREQGAWSADASELPAPCPELPAISRRKGCLTRLRVVSVHPRFYQIVDGCQVQKIGHPGWAIGRIWRAGADFGARGSWVSPSACRRLWRVSVLHADSDGDEREQPVGRRLEKRFHQAIAVLVTFRSGLSLSLIHPTIFGRRSWRAISLRLSTSWRDATPNPAIRTGAAVAE